MIPTTRRKREMDLLDSLPPMGADNDEAPTKAEILNGIRDGYAFVMSGGVGQPIDDAHREIAEELAREELAENADISR